MLPGIDDEMREFGQSGIRCHERELLAARFILADGFTARDIHQLDGRTLRTVRTCKPGSICLAISIGSRQRPPQPAGVRASSIPLIRERGNE